MAKAQYYRRKSDGFRLLLTAEELKDMDGSDYELFDDYVKRQLAPPAKAKKAESADDAGGPAPKVE